MHQHISRLHDYLQEQLRRLRGVLVRTWRRHRDRVVEESGYAEAFTEVVLAAAELFTENFRVRYSLNHLTTAYLSLLRVLRRPPDRWDTV